MVSKDEWRELVHSEINSIKQYFIQKYGWVLQTKEGNDFVHLFVRMHHAGDVNKVKVLRLTYGSKFPNERPREDFVNPDDYQEAGLAFWT